MTGHEDTELALDALERCRKYLQAAHLNMAIVSHRLAGARGSRASQWNWPRVSPAIGGPASTL